MAGEIPTVVAPQEVRTPTIDPKTAGAGWGAVASAFGEISQTGQYGIKVGSMIQRAEDHVLTLKASNQLLHNKNEFLEKISKHANYADYEQMTEDFIEQQRTYFNDAMSSRPAAANSFNPHLESTLEEVRHVTKMKYIDQLSKDAVDDTIKSLSGHATAWGTATNKDMEAVADSDADIAISTLVDAGLASPKDARKMKDYYGRQKEESRVITLTKGNNLEDIDRGIALLQDDDPKTGLTMLSPKERAALLVGAENHREVVKNKQDRETDDLKTNKTMANISRLAGKGDGSIDYSAARQLMKSPEFLENNGLNDKDGNPNQKLLHHIDGLLKEEETSNEHIQREKSGKIAKDVIENIKDKKLKQSREMLNKYKEQLTESDYRTLANAITSEEKYIRSEARAERQEGRERRREAGDKIFNDLVVKMTQQGQMLDDVKDIYGKMPEGLSASQAGELVRINKEYTGPIKTALGNANKFLHTQIAPSKGAFLPSIPEEEKRYYEAQQDLFAWTKEQKSLAAQGKRNALTEEDIKKQAEVIVPKYRMKIDEKVNSVKSSLKDKNPSVGSVQDGYKFKGGNAADPKNWEKLKIVEEKNLEPFGF